MRYIGIIAMNVYTIDIDSSGPADCEVFCGKIFSLKEEYTVQVPENINYCKY